MSKFTMAGMIKACTEVLGSVPESISNRGELTQLERVLAELGVDHAWALCEWYNRASCTPVEALELANEVQVERLVCDNCGEAEYRCHPPGWDNYQGCQDPYDVGAKCERPDGDVFICTACWDKNPAFRMLS